MLTSMQQINNSISTAICICFNDWLVLNNPLSRWLPAKNLERSCLIIWRANLSAEEFIGPQLTCFHQPKEKTSNLMILFCLGWSVSCILICYTETPHQVGLHGIKIEITQGSSNRTATYLPEVALEAGNCVLVSCALNIIFNDESPISAFYRFVATYNIKKARKDQSSQV